MAYLIPFATQAVETLGQNAQRLAVTHRSLHTQTFFAASVLTTAQTSLHHDLVSRD